MELGNISDICIYTVKLLQTGHLWENGRFTGVAGFVKNSNVSSELSPFIVSKVLCLLAWSYFIDYYYLYNKVMFY